MSDQQTTFEKWNSLLASKPQPKPEAPEPEAVMEVAVQEEATVLSVSDLNKMVREQLEGKFHTLWLQGEISNFKPHTSGHFYFSLKDDKSQINAVMFKGHNSRLKFRPENGMEVIVRGRVTVYEPRGNYQVFCETMEPVGAGALQKAYEQLKAKLQAEGLFDPSQKQPLPFLPKRIGVVTSPTGAAIQDILNVLNRRYRAAHVTVIPARVQGDGAAQEVVRGIELANRIGNYDVLIVGRGGGSIEDLWCFNEEIVARAIYKSKIPIISAVGHEIDFTIADFVADYRAPTPSAAAEVVAKSVSELLEKIKNQRSRMTQVVQFRMSHWMQKLNHMQSRLVDPKRHLQDLSLRCDEAVQRLQLNWQRFVKDKTLHVRLMHGKLKSPKALIDLRRKQVENLNKNLKKEVKMLVTSRRTALESFMGLMDSLSPLKVLNRGYAVVFKGSAIVRDPKSVKPKDHLVVQVDGGAVEVEVISETKKRIEF